MKPALFLTLCLATVLRAEEPAPPQKLFQIPDPAPLSPAQQQVNDSLPKYDSAATKERGTVGTPSPDAIELPKIKVTPKQRPRLTPEIVITNKGFEQKAAPLDKLLNASALLGGASAAERAREEEERRKKAELTADVNTIAKAVEAVNPAQAKALRDAVARP